MTTDIMGKCLLYRYTLSITKDAPDPGAESAGPQMDIVTSFYRGHVDPAYRLLVSNMIEDGLFDEFISGVLQGLVHQGKKIDCKNILYGIYISYIHFVLRHLFLGRQNLEYTHGFQSVATEFAVDDTLKPNWELVNQFLGKPERARLTYFQTRICLDFYFP